MQSQVHATVRDLPGISSQYSVEGTTPQTWVKVGCAYLHAHMYMHTYVHTQTHTRMCVCAQSPSRVQLFATLWTVALQAPLSMEFFRPECRRGLPFPLLGDLSDPGIEPMPLVSPAQVGGFFTTASPKACSFHVCRYVYQLPLKPVCYNQLQSTRPSVQTGIESV